MLPAVDALTDSVYSDRVRESLASESSVNVVHLSVLNSKLFMRLKKRRVCESSKVLYGM